MLSDRPPTSPADAAASLLLLFFSGHLQQSVKQQLHDVGLLAGIKLCVLVGCCWGGRGGFGVIWTIDSFSIAQEQ